MPATDRHALIVTKEPGVGAVRATLLKKRHSSLRRVQRAARLSAGRSQRARRHALGVSDGKQYLDKLVAISGRIDELARDKVMDFLRSNHAQPRIFFLEREDPADLLVNSGPALLATIQ